MEEGRERGNRDGNTISNKRLPGISKRVEGALGREKKRHLSCALSLLSVCAFVPVCLYLDLLINSMMNMKCLVFVCPLDSCPQYFQFLCC